jgi:mobilome CxxCx(11)CxxC protein
MTDLEQKYNGLRQDCWNESLQSFGKAYIFDKRAQRYSFYINLLKVFGIVVPVTVGATAIGYGFDSVLLKYSIALAIPLTIAQLIFSVCAIVYKWDDELSYSYEASQELSTLSDKFKRLAKTPPDDFKDFEHEFEILNTIIKTRNQQSSKHNLREWELRMGMRYSLREYQRKCAGCGEIPKSMEPTKCDVCGNFNKSKI